MELPLQITFRKMAASPAIEANIREKAIRLATGAMAGAGRRRGCSGQGTPDRRTHGRASLPDHGEVIGAAS